ncbi:hypothetical protein M440DRAFT_1396417 [Trichoderma longibrachiatum ATCC 18648]|uniref:Uncharacterized protein n=1 Tax=Trichoderma longibrachiatum ATCC 18648 TaxID=983965 RepID=A0A2T4CI88_TRILO|nr:hypothetical protein M440DRAFT_1396417 [Trichoderma longibrachiatum ATCC 18648]
MVLAGGPFVLDFSTRQRRVSVAVGMQRFLVCHWGSTLASLFSCTIRIAALGVVSAGVPKQDILVPPFASL